MLPPYQDNSAATLRSVVRPRSIVRKGICIHETIGEHSQGWLTGGSAASGNPVSVDFLIDRDGTIHQLVPLGYYTWHSGLARWCGYSDPDGSLNQSLIGVELENNPASGEKVTNAQYIALAALMRHVMPLYNINSQWVVGHYMIALPSGRKTDPITLDWAILWREYLAPSPEGLALAFPKVMP